MATMTEIATIKTLTTHYIDGAFVGAHGREFGTYGIEAFLEPRAILEA
jgi:hypothetical protein